MRLINTRTKELREFGEEDRGPYAILSHRWGSDEITLQEFDSITKCLSNGSSHPSTSKTGYRKVVDFCIMAESNGLDWAWVDTCCIDKTSSAELSEAINSMYRWYKDSRVCYVYLDDVSADDTDLSAENSPFRKSVWFTRGWTLQELIAPRNLSFFSNSWTFLGDRSNVEGLLEEITGIWFSHLKFGLHHFSVAQRMCWAAKRKTTRKEDIAYCLLGIFDINMPLLYGEGYKAFQRLQEEIIRRYTDQTIFAWGFEVPGDAGEVVRLGNRDVPDDEVSILANSPYDFIGCADIVPRKAWKPRRATGVEITQKGLRFKLPMTMFGHGVLECCSLKHPQKFIAIRLVKWPLSPGFSSREYAGKRLRYFPPEPVSDPSTFTAWKSNTIYFERTSSVSSPLVQKHSGSRLAMILSSRPVVYESLHVHHDLLVLNTGHNLFVSESQIPCGDRLEAFFSCRRPGSMNGSSTPDCFYIMVEFYRQYYLIFEVFKSRFRLALPTSSQSIPPTPQTLKGLAWRDRVQYNGETLALRSRLDTSYGPHAYITTLETITPIQARTLFFSTGARLLVSRISIMFGHAEWLFFNTMSSLGLAIMFLASRDNTNIRVIATSALLVSLLNMTCAAMIFERFSILVATIILFLLIVILEMTT